VEHGASDGHVGANAPMPQATLAPGKVFWYSRVPGSKFAAYRERRRRRRVRRRVRRPGPRQDTRRRPA
jgi:hypothetical protein